MAKRITMLIKHSTKKKPENWKRSSIMDNYNLKEELKRNRIGLKNHIIYITSETNTIIDTVYPVIDARINSTIYDIAGARNDIQIKIDTIPQNAYSVFEILLSFILSNNGFKKLKHQDAVDYIKNEVIFGIVRRSVNRGEGAERSVLKSQKNRLLRSYMKFGVELNKLTLGCNNHICFNISISGHDDFFVTDVKVSLEQLSDRIKTLNKKIKNDTINDLNLLEISVLKGLRQIVRFNECIEVYDFHPSPSTNNYSELLYSNLGNYLFNRKFLGEFYKFSSSKKRSNKYHELKKFSYRSNCVEDIMIDANGITIMIKCSVSNYGSQKKIWFSKKRLLGFSQDFILAGANKINITEGDSSYNEFQLQWLLMLVKTFRVKKKINSNTREHIKILTKCLHALYARKIKPGLKLEKSLK